MSKVMYVKCPDCGGMHTAESVKVDPNVKVGCNALFKSSNGMDYNEESEFCDLCELGPSCDMETRNRDVLKELWPIRAKDLFSREPRTFLLPFTYEPKIEGVKAGRITQTIRRGRREYKVGDRLRLYGYAGRKQRSAHSWDLWATVTGAWHCYFTYEHIYLHEDLLRPATNVSGCTHIQVAWNFLLVDNLATLDGIDPPTGYGLRDILFGLNKKSKGAEGYYTVVRWKLE